MKKALLISAFVALCAFVAPAQNIALGERVSELKATTWLGGRQPASAPLTYIEFFHSSNPACITSIEQLQGTAQQMRGQLRILVVTQESEEKISPLLSGYISDLIGVAVDPAGRSFANFGVNYIPFGVLVDAKNRALWMGNSLQITPEFIEKISR